MPKKASLGQFEILVLSTLVRLAPDAYGISVRNEIRSRLNRNVSLGAIYTTLGRMEKKGLVTSRLGGATSKRGGRSKRYYELTAVGRSQLESALQNLQSISSAVLTGNENRQDAKRRAT